MMGGLKTALELLNVKTPYGCNRLPVFSAPRAEDSNLASQTRIKISLGTIPTQGQIQDQDVLCGDNQHAEFVEEIVLDNLGSKTTLG